MDLASCHSVVASRSRDSAWIGVRSAIRHCGAPDAWFNPAQALAAMADLADRSTRSRDDEW
jgi:hypothetical protein